MAAETVARGLEPARSGHCRRGPAGASLDSVLVSSRRGSQAQRMQVDRPSLGPAPLPQEEMGSVPPEGVRALGAAIAAELHPHPRPLWPWARPGAAARSDAQAPATAPPRYSRPPCLGALVAGAWRQSNRRRCPRRACCCPPPRAWPHPTERRGVARPPLRRRVCTRGAAGGHRRADRPSLHTLAVGRV